MSFFAIALALLLEQARPLLAQTPVFEAVRVWARWVQRTLDAGHHANGWLTWAAAVVLPTLVVAGVYGLLSRVGVVLGFAWTVGVLYLTLGFRQFSFHFTAVRTALESGDSRAAQAALTTWQASDNRPLEGARSHPELVRATLEQGLWSAHRHVFGVMVSFVALAALGLGPAGAVLYRLAQHVARRWVANDVLGTSEALEKVAQRGWCVIDAVPVRMSALAFAVVGNFEEAVSSWRNASAQPQCSHQHMLLAAASGAMNVRLDAVAKVEAQTGASASEEDLREPRLSHLASVVGLIWRVVVLWMVLLALATVARIW